MDMEILIWLEHTAFSTYIREAETLWGYPLVLILHGMGMAIVVGVSAMVGLRILGFAPRIPLEPMEKFFPFIWLGFWINALSGAVLVMCSATVMLTNWVMYIKFASIAVAVVCLRLLKTQVFPSFRSKPSVPSNAKMLAGTLLFAWAVAITAGRLTAYLGALVSPFHR
jgi:hypothetical protein